MYNTGSTSISNELCELYDGKRILKKHSRYHEFLKTATEEQKKYFVFSGIRNPMDSIISVYSKFVSNHKGKFTNPGDWKANGGYVKERQLKLYADVKSSTLTSTILFNLLGVKRGLTWRKKELAKTNAE